MTTIIPFSITITLCVLVTAPLLLSIVFLRPVYQRSASKGKPLPLLLLALLIIVQSVLAAKGFFAQTIQNTPPPAGMAILVIMSVTLYLALRYPPFKTLTANDTINLAYLQTFRLPLEMIFVWLLSYQAIPLEMTFEGRNPDILIGLTAPVVAFAVERKWLPIRALVVWNFIGLGFLFNIMTVAILCLPTTFRVFYESVPNEFVLYFPYNLIPVVLVMMALFLHLLSLKTLLRKAKV
jgi:hypothetical protein